MEKQQPESEDGIEGLRTTVRYPTAAKRKQEVGPGACAEKARACAVRGGPNPSPDMEVEGAEGGETVRTSWKAGPLQLRGRAASPASRRAPEAFPSGSRGPR